MNRPSDTDRRIATRTAQGLDGARGRSMVGVPLDGPRASKGRIVVGTWGGDYARLLNKNIEKPFLIPDGWEVVQDQAGDPQRRSKMLAEKRLPRGTTDVQGLSARQHVPDERGRRGRDHRLFEAQERGATCCRR